MTEYDINNLRDAVSDWKEHRPKKELPSEVPADAPPIPTGPQTIKSYGITEDADGLSITETEESAWIGAPIMPRQ